MKVYSLWLKVINRHLRISTDELPAFWSGFTRSAFASVDNAPGRKVALLPLCMLDLFSE
jgi:hypothetical protein